MELFDLRSLKNTGVVFIDVNIIPTVWFMLSLVLAKHISILESRVRGILKSFRLNRPGFVHQFLELDLFNLVQKLLKIGHAICDIWLFHAFGFAS